MRAAVFWETGRPVTLEEISLRKVGRREVVVQTAFAGICHSDLHFMDGLFGHPLPFVPGHESSGVVEMVGEDVTHVKKGDHVVTCLSVFCGCCPQCVTGHPTLCEGTEVKLPAGVSDRLSLSDGRRVHQFANLSSFADQMLIHENALVRIDKDLPLDIAAVVGCGVLTGVGAVIHAAKVKPGATVAVIGCGGVGLSVVAGAALAGAGRIIAIDKIDHKLDLASKLGATDTINAEQSDPVQEILALTGGGVAYSFEALGLKKTAEQAFAMLKPGGTATVLGMIKPGVKLEFEGGMFIKDRKVQGSAMGSNQFRVDIPNILNFYRQGRLKLDHIVSDRISLNDLNTGFEQLRSGAAVRQVVDFSL